MHRRPVGLPTLSLAVLALACAADPAGGSSTAGPGTSAGSSADGGEASSSSDADGGGDEGPTRLDAGSASSSTGASSSGGPEGGLGCRRVDLLFVVDNSSSMWSKQQKFVPAVPAFIDTIRDKFRGTESYNIGVVTSDAYAWNQEGCREYGALVTTTGGRYTDNAPCGPYASGARYMTHEDELSIVLDCALRVGIDGADEEHVMESTVRAVGPELAAPGACNAGFMREETLLVIVILTDEDDPGSCPYPMCPGSTGSPAEWRDAIVAQKGDPEHVVVAALVRGAPGNVCAPPEGAERDGTRTMEFVGLFGDNGIVGDICADDYAPFFTETVSRIVSRCDFDEG